MILTITESGSITFSKLDPPARCAVTQQRISSINGIDIFHTTYGSVEGLPDSNIDTYYIVSLLVRTALPGRIDLLSPGELVRNADGVVIGCKNFNGLKEY